MMNPIELLSNFSKANIVKSIREQNAGARKRLFNPAERKPESQINPAIALRESRVLYFLFNYLKFMKIDVDVNAEERKNLYVKIWTEVINALK